jgi:hypothetical protein
MVSPSIRITLLRIGVDPRPLTSVPPTRAFFPAAAKGPAVSIAAAKARVIAIRFTLDMFQLPGQVSRDYSALRPGFRQPFCSGPSAGA